MAQSPRSQSSSGTPSKKFDLTLRSRDLSTRRFLLVAVTAAALLFLVELYSGAGLAAAPAWALILYLGLWAPRQRYTLAVAGVASLLVILTPVFAPPPGPLWQMVLNRALAIAIIWMAAFTVLRCKHEESLRRRREEMFRIGFEYAATGSAITDNEGCFLRVNPSLCRLLGYSQEELCQLTWADVTHPDDAAASLDQLRRLNSGEIESFQLEKRYRHKRGDVIWCQVTVSAVRDEEGRHVFRSVQLIDTTERKKAEEELRASEEWFRSSFDNAGIGMAINSLDGKWIQVNPALCRMFGYSENELKQLTWQDLTHPDDMSLTEAGLNRLLAKELPAFDAEKRYVHKDGRSVWAHVTVSFIRDAEGNPRRFTAQIVDITGRKRIEEALNQQRRFVDRIVETEPNLILVADLQTRSVVYVNGRVAAILGYSPDEIVALGGDVSSLWHPDDQETSAELARHLGEAADGEIVEAEYRLKHADGGWRWLWERASVLTRDDHGRPVLTVGTAQDVTERREMEAALVKSEETLRHQHHELRELTARLMRASEEERARLALELHDDLNQRLAALGLDLGRAQREFASESPEFAGRFDALQEQVGRLSDDVRNLAYRLHPSVLDYLGLEAALESECTQFSDREGIPAEFSADNVPSEIPHDVALCLYRIAQESLRNIARHAESEHAGVTLAGHAGGIRLRVVDSGQGFSSNPATRSPGLGIIGMQERARMINGELKVESVAGRGTVVEVWVPPDEV